jgi:o-succinylbenzoate---CoA ligase
MDSSSTIDWHSHESEILLNPKLSEEAKNKAFAHLPLHGEFVGHLWLATSGSTGNESCAKYVALSKQSILASARAVNAHLNISGKDVWINPLPRFHVGGLGIFARAYLNGAKVASYEGKWNPTLFCDLVKLQQGTLTALVPTQVYDLVTAGLRAPSSLRAVIVGGGQLNKALYAQAHALGWKLLPSYGLTEASSQVATAVHASEAFPPMQILPHIQAKVDSNGCILLKGSSLLTCYAYISQTSCQIKDPKVEGWLTTEDKGEIDGNSITIFGRDSDFYKIGGESVDLKHLENILDGIRLKLNLSCDAALIALEDSRLGHAIHLAVGGTPQPYIDQLIETFQQTVLPFERIKRVHYLPELPRSPLNKLLRSALHKALVDKGSV